MELLFLKLLPRKVNALSKLKYIDIQRINPNEPNYGRIRRYLGKHINLELINLDPLINNL